MGLRSESSATRKKWKFSNEQLYSGGAVEDKRFDQFDLILVFEF